jgi:hypothetical protein
MKPISFMIAVFLICQVVQASKTPEELLNSLPAPPGNSCQTSPAEKETYVSAVDRVIDEIDEEIDKRRAIAERPLGNEAMAVLAAQYGLSQEELARVAGGQELTEAEKEALADKMLNQKYDISMAEARQVQKMSEQAREAWARAYAAGLMADIEAGQAETPDKPEAAQAPGELLAEMMSLGQTLKAEEQRLQQQLAELDQDPAGSCEMLAPRQSAILRDYSGFMKRSLPDFKRLDELALSYQRAELGAVASEISEIQALEALRAYAQHLQEAYKFTER